MLQLRQISLLLAALTSSCGILTHRTDEHVSNILNSIQECEVGEQSLDIFANTLPPDIVILKEFYCLDSHPLSDIYLSPWLHDIKSHPNNVNGDYIILNLNAKESGSITTYSEHIAAFDYDEFGIWYSKNDTLVFKPLSYAISKDGVIITVLEEAKEKLFWLYGDYLYEVTEYEVVEDADIPLRMVIYDTVPSEYLNYRNQLAGWMWQRIFKIMMNKERLLTIMKLSKE